MAEMKEMDIFHSYLKQKRLKRTVQRDIILDEFLKIESHITPEELYHIIKKTHRNIGLSTIYRTLKLLSECNLAREMLRKDGTSIFEHMYNHPHHDHLLCNYCGRYFEFYNQDIENLQKKVAEDHNFTMTSHRMLICGICSECRNMQK